MPLTIFAGDGGFSEDQATIDHRRTMVFSFVVFYEMLLAFIIRLHYKLVLFSNPLLWVAILVALALQAVVIYTPLAPYFGIVPLVGKDLATLGPASLIFLGVFLLYSKISKIQGITGKSFIALLLP